MGYFGRDRTGGGWTLCSREEEAPKEDCESLLWVKAKSGSSSRICPGVLGVEEEAESSTLVSELAFVCSMMRRACGFYGILVRVEWRVGTSDQRLFSIQAECLQAM